MKHFYISLGTNLFLVVIILLAQGFLPPQVPLFYGRVVSEKQLASSYGLLIVPLTSTLITLINFSLIKWVIKDVFLKKILTYTSLFINLLTAITVIKIILLVGSFK